jgi:hypothetical protein
MPQRELNPGALELNEDWEGNNAAFACPVCQKVFIVSGFMHKGVRECPHCRKSVGRVEGGPFFRYFYSFSLVILYSSHSMATGRTHPAPAFFTFMGKQQTVNP